MEKRNYINNTIHAITGLLCMVTLFFSNIVLAQSNNIVGSLGGDVNVSSMGLASYSIPIDVVPGTRGVQPNLAVVYGSSSGRGYLGCNWQLSGLSSITRVPRTQYPDGSIGTINFDGNDRYALDGVKLMKLSAGNYAATNAKYGLETENYTRVTLKGTPDTDGQYFVAVTDQGVLVEYGKTSDSKQKTADNKIVSWLVNKITDGEGNYMTISYGQNTTNGEIWPIEINYTGNSIVNYATYAKVEFIYTTDSNTNTSYIGGQAVRPTKLLTDILIKYGNDLVRQYTFNYSYDRSTRLDAVILKDALGVELTRTSFGWGRDHSAATYQTFSNYTGYAINTGDYNGDNITDLCLYAYPNGICNWQVMLGNRDGSFSSSNFSGSLNGVTGLFNVDLEGNGKDGLGYCTYDSDEEEYTFNVIKSVGTPNEVLVYPATETSTFYLGDFLGVGGSQFLFQSKPSGDYVTLTLKKKNEQNNTWFSVSLSVNKNSKVAVTDFNGNGKSDIHIVNGTTVDIYEYSSVSNSFVKILNSATLTVGTGKDYFGDFNGDGKQDYIRFKNAHWYLKMSKGDTYTNDQALSFANSTSSTGEPIYPIFVYDINGDGKDDIIQPVYDYNTDKTTLNVYYTRSYNNGTCQFESQTYQNNNIISYNEMHYRFADLNCDGKVELLYTGAAQEAPVMLNFKERREHDLIRNFVNGISKLSTVEYAYYNSPNIGYFGIEGKRVVFPLVSKLSEPNGIGGVAETIFTYGQALYDFDRRQLMGFGQFNSYCNGTNTMMNYEYNDIYHHLNLEHALTYYLERGNNPVRGYVDDTSYWENNRNVFYYYEILNTLAYQGLSYNRFIPYYSYSSTIDKLQNRQQRKCSWLNASDGRLENSSVVNIDYESQLWLSRDSTHYTYTETTLHNGQTVNKISSIKTWNERNGFTQKPYQEVNYYYSTEGRLSTKNVSDSDGLIGVAAYSYNYLGFPTSETYTPNGLTARTRSFGYSNNYRFLTRETDALGHIQSVTFDDKTGLMTTQTDVNGLTTEFQYDALGRLTDVIRPDRTEHHIRYYWNDVSSFSNSVYYKREFEDGQPTISTYYDILGRTIHTYVAGKGYDDIVYNDLGLVSKTTYVPYETPSTFSSNKTWHNNNYDQYNRILWETDPYTNLSFVYYDYNNASMHEYFVTVTDSIRDTQQTKKYDALGRLTQATDEGGTINYSYSYLTEDDEIIDKLCVVVGVDTTTIKSDIRGNRLSIQDPDGGTVTNTYNALNQLTHQTNANLDQTEYTYDLGGRTTQIVYSHGIDSETISYTYDNASGSGIGKLASVKKNGSDDCVFVYDELGRLLNRKVYDGHSVYDHQCEYNNLGQLQYFTYPDSYCIEMVYNSYGELKQINNAADNSMIYATDTRNRFRQPLKCRYGNETGVQYTYNAYGMLTGIRNGDVVENNNIHNFGHSPDPEEDYTINTQYRQLSYTYNARGFIETRTDAKVNQSESYFYDKLDRLESYKVNGTTAASFLYEPTGNIHTHSKVGTYSYDENKTHAVVGIVGNSSCPIPASQCDVDYNFRNRPTSIAENGYSITLDYDAAGMRRHTRYYQGNAMQKSKARISDVYEVELVSGFQRRLDYIYAEGQLVAVHVKRGTADSLYYVLTDHLGSWNKVMDEDKNIVQQTHFDPWGNRMSYTAWNTPQTQISFPFSRGFTGHEHYDRFNIINANARLYDPVIGRFFSPDPFVQAPDFTQNYNRYSYCLNNPVMCCDPDGEFFWIPAVIIGAYLGGSAINGTFNPAKWDYSNWQTYAGMAVGGIAGYAGAAIGVSVATSAIASGANAVSAGMASGMIGGMASGGINGAGMTAIMGGNFSDIIGSMTMGMVVGGFSGALSGGVGSAIGDFSGVVGSSFKNGVYELGHSALKGAATGLAGGAMMAAMEQDASYLWKGAAIGAAFSIGMAGLRIGALGTAFIPDADIYCEVPDYGQVYRRGSIFMSRGSGITLGRNVSVKFTGDTDYDRYVLQHETGHLNQINDMGIAKFYGRTVKEYAHHLFRVGDFYSVYRTPGTLEYAADYYAFQRLGYYYDWYGIRYIFP